MQVKMTPNSVDALHEKYCSEVLERGNSEILAVKPISHGRIYARLELKTLPYMTEEHQFWLSGIHFKKGRRIS